jgi:hypothetical protein
MALMGSAAVAMWWNIAPADRTEFEHWHSHEHFPERMGIPGFRRGSRWADADGGEGFFVCYELDGYEVLTSDPYRARLNAPTPWSTKMMPLHRGMVRSQCIVLASEGGSLAGRMLTVRFSARSGQEADLKRYLTEGMAGLAGQPGITGAHLLHTRTPAASATTEQRIRGGRDAAADWIALATGYDEHALKALADGPWSEAALVGQGARDGVLHSRFTLSDSRTPADH